MCYRWSRTFVIRLTCTRVLVLFYKWTLSLEECSSVGSSNPSGSILICKKNEFWVKSSDLSSLVKKRILCIFNNGKVISAKCLCSLWLGYTHWAIFIIFMKLFYFHELFSSPIWTFAVVRFRELHEFHL